ETVESTVADLESYIPEYMQGKEIPGVAICLIRDGKVVWTKGFGVVHTITGKPVTSETLFEVASNSKVVTAYVALRLVDQGKLALDKSLNSYLPDPWLPYSEYRDSITLRHVLSHSSGLGHNTLDRTSLFAPGRGYSYSGMGFLYLQAVIEHLEGQSLEDVAQELAFVPLGMSSTSYVNRDDLTPRTANGHVHAIVPIVLFTVPYLVSLVIVGCLGLLILRIWKGHWRPKRSMIIGAAAVAFGLTVLTVFLFLGGLGLLEFAWLITFCGLIMASTFALAFVLGRRVLSRLFPQRIRHQSRLVIAWSVITLFGLILLASEIANVPVPRWPAVPAGAASSVRATAGDMAAFLIELSSPRHLSHETARQLQEPQVRLSSDLSWGLGPGIQHSEQGNALWQWGQHIDFQSVMIIYPEHGFGVVVLTNNDLFSPEVAIDLAHRALGGKIDPIHRGSHLEFDYREGTRRNGEDPRQ
ncbi:MAG: beta-lactamase family protein, partial [Ignavibacteria bacterium]|nr:beta-lactamase family protein [Ignavibacteria bacterium]